VQVNEETPRDPWREARERGIEFRAVGQEPGWFLEIDQQREMRLLYDYAEREAREPAPLPVIAGDMTTWDAGRLRASSVDRLCHDGMSGQPFPRTVTVVVDGRELHGCGRALAP
jgi:putative lipoprotein